MRYYFLSILSIGSLLISCTKDKVSPFDFEGNSEICDCQDIPQYQGLGNGYIYNYDSSYYLWPMFHPLDDNRFLYVKKENSLYKIYTYDQINHSSFLVHEGVIKSAPQWGANDWIIFAGQDNKIYKLKPNGDSLTLLTEETGNWFHPKVNISGDYFISYKAGVGMDTSIIFNINGDPIDSISLYFAKGDWKHPFCMAVARNDQLTLTDFNTDQTISTINFNNYAIDSYFWIGQENGILTNINGIYRVNPFSSQMTQLKETCNSRLFFSGSINNSKTKALFSKLYLDIIDSNNLQVSRKLVTLDMLNLNEEVILE